MREIYNEGRVAGLSSWELYARHTLSVDPSGSPLNERQWLSASLSSNSSMILRIPKGTQPGYHDYILPEGSELCGCSVIYGTVFEGEVSLDEDGVWAVRVDDYGRLISNTLDRHPVTPGTSEYVPAKIEPVRMNLKFKQQCRDYLKVTGAMMFQPGEWQDSVYYTNLLTELSEKVVTEMSDELLVPKTDSIAIKNIEPDMSALGFIRLAIDQTIDDDFYIYFHGFSYKTLALGEVGYAQIETKGNPQDGDFLGPVTYPWGCKVNLLVTNDVLRVALNR